MKHVKEKNYNKTFDLKPEDKGKESETENKILTKFL